MLLHRAGIVWAARQQRSGLSFPSGNNRNALDHMHNSLVGHVKFNTCSRISCSFTISMTQILTATLTLNVFEPQQTNSMSLVQTSSFLLSLTYYFHISPAIHVHYDQYQKFLSMQSRPLSTDHKKSEHADDIWERCIYMCKYLNTFCSQHCFMHTVMQCTFDGCQIFVFSHDPISGYKKVLEPEWATCA